MALWPEDWKGGLISGGPGGKHRAGFQKFSAFSDARKVCELRGNLVRIKGEPIAVNPFS